MREIVADIAAALGLKRRHDRWVGRCPDCGGSATSDRFQFRDDGGYKCYGCALKGDIITWLRREGKSCPEAHDIAGRGCHLGPACAVWGTCRHGDGSARDGQPRRRPRHPPAAVAVPQGGASTLSLSADSGASPSPAWRQELTAILDVAQDALASHPQALGWLAKRGIDSQAAARYRLGWQARNGRLPWARIDLTPIPGKDGVWMPVGLVIPTYDAAGMLHRVRIRRPSWTRDKFLPELKYVWIQGGGKEPMVLRPASASSRGAVIVEAELDAIAVAASHPEVTVVALGTVRGPITTDLHAELSAAPVILVALDADGPGAAAINAWRQEFRQAIYWPVPAGKDPGEYAATHPGALQEWIEAALPPPLMRFADSGQQGVGGALPPRAENKEDPARDLVRVSLAGGEVVYITDDREQWDALAAQGHAVFTTRELKRLDGLHLLPAALLQVIAVKQAMSGYVRHARPV